MNTLKLLSHPGRLLAVVLALVIPSLRGPAQNVPPLINYQGQLSNPDGSALPTADYTLTFNLYDAATNGALVWGPQVFDGAVGAGRGAQIPVVQGWFNVMLGPVDIANRPLSDAFNGTARFVEVTVSNRPPIAPRQQILTTAFAFQAANSAKLAGNDWSAVFGVNDPVNGKMSGTKIANGTITSQQIAGSGLGLTNLNADNLAGGTVPNGRIGGTYSGAVTFNNGANSFSGTGAGLTSLNANNLSSGTVADARLSANVELLNANQTVTGAKTFNGGLIVNDTVNFPAIGRLAAVNEITIQSGGGGNGNGIYLNPFVGNPVQVGGALNVAGGVTAGAFFSGTGSLDQDGLELGNSVGAPSTQPHIDFHFGVGTPQDYNMRIINGADGELGFYRNPGGTSRLIIKSGGRVGIGIDNPGYTLEVNGTAHRSDNNANWTTTSDRRLKEDIQSIENALSLVSGLRPVNFRYSAGYRAANPALPESEQYGVVAQEFQKVFPDFVGTNSEGHLTVNSSPLPFVNCAAIQELDQKLKQRDAQIDELKSRLDALERKLNNE